MSAVNYKLLYSLQTKVLQLFNSIKGPFYLTGGTALGRFYLGHRFSADLDFFVNGHEGFRKDLEPYMRSIKTNFNVQNEGSLITDDFVRLLIVQEQDFLKIEFVNDIQYRYKLPIQNSIYAVDTVRNILSNKITCIVGRDEPKDFFDIISIAMNYQFNWIEIFNEAKEKALINEIDVSQRIAEFPTEWLLKVDWLEQAPDIKHIKSMQDIISNEILLGKRNSLCIKRIDLDEAVINFK